MLIKQLINVRKLRTHWVSNGDLQDYNEQLVSNAVDDCFIRRLLKKNLNLKLKLVHWVQSMQVSTWLSNIAFIVMYLAANLVAIDQEFDLETFQRYFSSFCTLPSEDWSGCVVRLESEQTPLSQTGYWFYPCLDLLLSMW